jgi:hypothetical protein
LNNQEDDEMPAVASQYQTLPASAGHSHSIVNELLFDFVFILLYFAD